MRKIFVTGIGTDVGKTFVSAILVEALKADYWKPVQTGSYFSTDSSNVQKWISNNESKIHPEAFLLKQYMSPHAAAELDGVNITLDAINLPHTTNKTLIVEGAGGLMVPLNKKEYIIDFIKKFDMEVILVVQNYLGSINHSLLSIDALKNRGAKILGIVYNGPGHQLSHDIIQEYAGLKVLGKIHKEPEINQEVVLNHAKQFEYLQNN
ncbi:MAG: dethiobiotin synthase [Bacteroidota bacterium]